MDNALNAAASGMLAQQLRIDTIANNLANANTPGFKGSAASFKDLLYRAAPAGSSGSAGVHIGSGAAAATMSRDLQQGALRETGVATDLAIEGEGFFRVRRTDGTVGYTRAGNFQLDAAGRLTTASGDLVVPPIVMPAGSTDLVVAPDGAVSARRADGARVDVGRLVVARFENPAALAAAGDGLLLATDASGPAVDGGGVVRQGYVEASNVSMTTEMTALIEAQRAFGVLSKVASAADEMHGMANSLRR